uniref:Abnormal cell migration protein 18-like fibronectin type I domain-containing protein n=1 Tax=Acrobeloides nanus TaxID=290746 RepID=A0A914C8V6_9BILA
MKFLIFFSFFLFVTALDLVNGEFDRKNCIHNGVTYKEGEEFHEKNSYLRWQCEDGSMIIKSCIDFDGNNVKPGQDFQNIGKISRILRKFHCFKDGETIGYNPI